ncbi:MAG: hypothetical protein H0V62_03040 [Gammaproteobacteria bacterium]|nr:hypothetical protein [Gammaproteobacteria bacterium]
MEMATFSALLSWAVLLSGYAEPQGPPELEYKPHTFFVSEACGGDECEAIGWYNDAHVVYLDERMRGDNRSDTRSLVVHELVHYLQHLSGKYDSLSCADQIAREREAYAIQRIYMAEAHGQPQFQQMRPPLCDADYEGVSGP